MNIIDVFKSLLKSNQDSFLILDAYIEQLKCYKDNIEKSVGVSIDDVLKEVKKVQNVVKEIQELYYEGKIRDALEFSRKLLYEDYYVDIPVGSAFFRARGSDSGFLYSKDEMFHIPFDKRYLIGNQRFGISGLPCLYLGGSSYICWEELGRPDYNRCNFSGFKNKEVVHVYDLCIPSKLRSLRDVRKSALVLVCSLPANPQHVFKEQYIVPQCIFQALIDKHYNSKGVFSRDEIYGIRYYSTHFLIGDMDFFSFSASDTTQMNRIIDYVFPSLSKSRAGFSKLLTRVFESSSTTSIMSQTIKDASFYVSAENDEYLDSLFGAVDDVLRNEIGLPMFRKKVEFRLRGKCPWMGTYPPSQIS